MCPQCCWHPQYPTPLQSAQYPQYSPSTAQFPQYVPVSPQDAASVADVVVWGSLFPVLQDETSVPSKSRWGGGGVPPAGPALTAAVSPPR